jgi:nicotinamide mononucleotide transporter
MSPLEIAANAFNLLAVFLARQNHVFTWPIGILACGLFAVLFYQVKLYADVALQVFFILASIYGWWKWRFGGGDHPGLPITTLQPRLFAGALALAGILTAAYGFALHRSTDASFPWVDSGVLMLSILGQLLLMMRKLENWIVWIGVNLVATPLYASKGLYLTSGIYFVFLLMAFWGLTSWRTILKNQDAALTYPSAPHPPSV